MGASDSCSLSPIHLRFPFSLWLEFYIGEHPTWSAHDLLAMFYGTEDEQNRLLLVDVFKVAQHSLNSSNPTFLPTQSTCPSILPLQWSYTSSHRATVLEQWPHPYKADPWMVAKITNMITRVISTKLHPYYIGIPSGQRLLQTIQGFKELTGLPNMCGAIDGSHISLHKEPNDEVIYKCRHNFYVVVLQAVFDHGKVFWDVSVRAPRGTDDSTHLRESSLFEKFTSAQVLMDVMITIRGHQLRPYLAGNRCYPLLSFLLVPFSSNGSGTPAQNLFDATLIRGKSVVEQAIGFLKGRWRMLQDMNVGLGHAPQTIVACCVLHNLCQLSGEPEPFMCRDPWENGPATRTTDNDKSINYFEETSRQALLEDFQEGHQRVSMR